MQRKKRLVALLMAFAMIFTLVGANVDIVNAEEGPRNVVTFHYNEWEGTVSIKQGESEPVKVRDNQEIAITDGAKYVITLNVKPEYPEDYDWKAHDWNTPGEFGNHWGMEPVVRTGDKTYRVGDESNPITGSTESGVWTLTATLHAEEHVDVFWCEYEAFEYDDHSQFQLDVVKAERGYVQVSGSKVPAGKFPETTEEETAYEGVRYNFAAPAAEGDVNLTFVPNDNAVFEWARIDNTVYVDEENGQAWEDPNLKFRQLVSGENGFVKDGNGNWSYSVSEADSYQYNEEGQKVTDPESGAPLYRRLEVEAYYKELEPTCIGYDDYNGMVSYRVGSGDIKQIVHHVHDESCEANHCNIDYYPPLECVNGDVVDVYLTEKPQFPEDFDWGAENAGEQEKLYGWRAGSQPVVFIGDQPLTVDDNGDADNLTWHFTYTYRPGEYVEVFWSEYDAFSYNDRTQFQLETGTARDDVEIQVSPAVAEENLFVDENYGTKYNFDASKIGQVKVTFVPGEDCYVSYVEIGGQRYFDSDLITDDRNTSMQTCPNFSKETGNWVYTFTAEDVKRYHYDEEQNKVWDTDENGDPIYDCVRVNVDTIREQDIPANTNATYSISGQEYWDGTRICINGRDIQYPENWEVEWEDEENRVAKPVNGTIDYYLPNGVDKVNICFGTLFIREITKIEINGADYTNQIIDYADEDTWLAHCGGQVVEFTITDVPKADAYNIVLDTIPVDEEHNNQEHTRIGNFLWTYDATQVNVESPEVDDLIDHATIEFVNLNYKGRNYSLEELRQLGLPYMDWSEANQTWFDEWDPEGEQYQVNPWGSSVLPAGSYLTVKLTPEYGYQLTDFTVNGSTFTAEENQSEFTFEIKRGNFHLGAHVTPMADVVATEGAKGVSDGDIELSKGVITSGSAVFTVEDTQVSAAETTAFTNAATGYIVDSYLDLGLEQRVYKGNTTDYWSNDMSELDGRATVSLKMDAGLADSHIEVVHQKHDGSYEVLPATYDAATKTVTFATDSFSKFAIAYKAPAPPAPQPCTHQNTELRGAVAATVNSTGYTGDTYCKDCGELVQKGNVIPAVVKKNSTIQPVKDTKSSSAASYSVTSTSKNTVTYKASKTTSSTAKVPDTIKDANGKTYKVTAVASKAFYKNKKVKTVTVGKNTTTIGTSAFKQATKLTTVTLNGKVTSIGKEAFSGSSKLSKITLNGNALKSVGKNAFKGVKKNCKITIQAKDKKQYEKIVKLIKKSGAKNVKFAYKKKK